MDATARATIMKTASGRTPLPNARPASVGMARDTSLPSGNKMGAARMERQISTAYLNAASSTPYVNRAEAEDDQRSAIKEVNSTSMFGQYLAKCSEREKKLDRSKEPHQGISKTGNLRKKRNSSQPEYQATKTREELDEAKNAEPGPSADDANQAAEALMAMANAQQQVAGDSPGRKTTRSCDECRKNFSRSEHLRRHVRTVHRKGMEAKCSLCGSKFSRRDNGLVHVTRCSGGDGPARIIDLSSVPSVSSASTGPGSSGPSPERAQSSNGSIANKDVDDAEVDNRPGKGPTEGVEGSRGLQYPGTRFTPINRPSGPTSTCVASW